MDAYEIVRKKDARVVRNLPERTFILIAEQATSAGRADVMDNLATDIVGNLRGLNVVSSILDVYIRYGGSTSNAHLRPLLRLLQASTSDSGLLNRLLEFLFNKLCHDLSSVSLPTVLRLLDRLLKQLAPGVKGAAAVIYRPPDAVQMSFVLIEKLIQARQLKNALRIFKILVKRNNIPPEAIRDTNHTTTDPEFIVLSTLVRSCLHWGWRTLAMDLCKILLRKKIVVPTHVINLTVDVLSAVLKAPDEVVLQQFSRLAVDLGTHALDFEIPHELIRLYYELAHTYRQGKSAKVLFEYTQSSIVSRYTYPHPHGPALVWLLYYLTEVSGDLHLASRLVDYAVEHCESIPPQDRARFIALAATFGFGRQAKTLWELCTVGRYRDLVCGNGATMLKLVRIFANVARKSQSSLAQTIDREQREGVTEVTQTMREIYEYRNKSASTFTDSVITEFRRLYEPIALADHFHLNALARAYFMVGDVAAGFSAFQALLDRNEKPNVYDINVALSAMAEYSPSGAANMITRMIEKGLQPDPVTFGTVIHFAALHKDAELVSSLIKLARVTDSGESTVKSLQSLIRASIVMANHPEILSENLDRALEIVRSLRRAGLCSPRTGTYCVKSALKVNSPVLAFKFWRLLVKGRLAWTDVRHEKLRRSIAKQIHMHYKAGWLSEERARVMQFLIRAERYH